MTTKCIAIRLTPKQATLVANLLCDAGLSCAAEAVLMVHKNPKAGGRLLDKSVVYGDVARKINRGLERRQKDNG